MLMILFQYCFLFTNLIISYVEYSLRFTYLIFNISYYPFHVQNFCLALFCGFYLFVKILNDVFCLFGHVDKDLKSVNNTFIIWISCSSEPVLSYYSWLLIIFSGYFWLC